MDNQILKGDDKMINVLGMEINEKEHRALVDIINMYGRHKWSTLSRKERKNYIEKILIDLRATIQPKRIVKELKEIDQMKMIKR